MPVSEHGQLTTSEGIHIDYQWSYTDAAARTGASGFVATDVGKKARQLDDNTLWMLTATTPTWVKTGGPDSAIDHGSISGLTDIADHPGYLDLAGTRPLTGSLDLGDNNITNVGNIALDSISSDAGTSIAVTLGTDAGDDFNVGSGKLVVEGDTGNVGIGEASPGVALTIVETSAGAFQPTIRVQNADNTTGSAAGVVFTAHASVGAASYSKAAVVFERTASIGRGNLHLCNDIVADTNNVALSDAVLTLDVSGNVGIGITTASAKLHIDQSSATGAQPVLYLDQADVDQPIFQIETTIGTGNAVEAVGAKTLTTTHFVMLKLPGGLTRYFEVGTIA